LADRDKEFEVVIENGPTRRSVALVERGRTDEFCQDQAPAGSRCRYTGTFVTWGRLRQLTVSDAGEVTVEGARQAGSDDGDGLNWGVGWLVDADFAQAFLSDSDRICNEARRLVDDVAIALSCDDDTSVRAWSADVGVTFARFIAFKVGYLDLGRVNFDLTGIGSDTSASVRGHFGRTRGATFSGVVRVDVGPVVPFVEAGAWRWSADATADILVTGPTPISTSTSRHISGWNPIFGAGVEFWPTRYAGVSAGFRLIPLREDIDTAADLVTFDDSFRLMFVGLKLGWR
jgi:hypothetical protein